MVREHTVLHLTAYMMNLAVNLFSESATGLVTHCMAILDSWGNRSLPDVLYLIKKSATYPQAGDNRGSDCLCIVSTAFPFS